MATSRYDEAPAGSPRRTRAIVSTVDVHTGGVVRIELMLSDLASAPSPQVQAALVKAVSEALRQSAGASVSGMLRESRASTWRFSGRWWPARRSVLDRRQ